MVTSDLTTDDVAAALRVHKATVQRLLKSGRLKGYQIGRTWRIPPAALEEFRVYESHAQHPPRHATAPMVISAPEDYDKWEQVLMAEDDLADAPPIAPEAMRRENIYGDRC